MGKQNKNTKRTSAPTVQRISKEEFNKLRKRSIRNKVIAGVCTFIVGAGVGAGAYYGISDCWLNKDVPTPPPIEQGPGQTEEPTVSNIVEYSATFDMASGYDDIESTLLDGYTILSEKDTNVNVPIEIDLFEQTRLNVVYKQLGSITIKNAVMHTFDVGTSNKNYILFDVAKLQELLGYDSKLYVTNSVILTGKEHVGDFGSPNYCVNGMPIDNVAVRPNRANYATHFGIELEDNLNPEENYYTLDKIHISVVLMYLD